MTNPTTIEPKARQVLHMVLENAIGLINRINNLLDISAFESKKSVQLRIEPVHIRELVEKAFQSLALTALSRKVQLVIDDSLSSAVVVRCDGERMLHVIVNLLSNAIKYTNSDTEVRVSYAQKADQHIISVADHGGGISPEDQKHIFDGYHRTASARHSEQYGTGLGLYLCAQIARAHGGSITVASSSHQGTTFSLALPNTLELSER
jgi:two-component system phosphate regulon sensor histidine kinase PhoR